MITIIQARRGEMIIEFQFTLSGFKGFFLLFPIIMTFLRD
ncbi:MAG: hypothetical protein JETT_3945 [Candidatus Jettenia ecosi]|uniref:Uncharacterized protein n=1 Tax=Candidatus Jettenia ecosi TaxID=2494326 RepID=A0A533QB20_9BACT|nr:MAG: hypothetical protein JETT_3945 [Candidatus Jettenia ecosi]